MPRTKQPATKISKHAAGTNGVAADTEVLTLAEASEYLRLPPKEILRLADEQDLPGRRIDDDWRFLKSALKSWLLGSSVQVRNQQFWQTHFGALKGDPYLDEMLADIYRRREHAIEE